MKTWAKKGIQYSVNYLSNTTRKLSFLISNEVQNCMSRFGPVVALESTIITHGMPYPENVKIALEVEEIIRQNGAIPATIGIIGGQIKIGLSKQEIDALGSGESQTIKVSTPDLPYVVSKEISGGTTVAATMHLSHQANIPVFVTGGIGGVHRGAETSFDVSHDLKALGHTPLSVVCAGVKSILDIGKTLEFLETEGVTIATFGNTTEFPSFITPKSGYHVTYSVQNPQEAARLINSRDKLKLPNAILFAVPISCENQGDGVEIESTIRQAIEEAEMKRISGKAVTPFILSRMNKLSGGISLKLNQALLRNNAVVGAKIALELNAIKKEGSARKFWNHKGIKKETGASRQVVADYEINMNKRAVIIGGINVDYVMNVQEEGAPFCGRTLRGRIQKTYGGVGRNLAECISKLYPTNIPLFISAVGNDDNGQQIKKDSSVIDKSGIAVMSAASTASYCAVIDNKGELLFGIGDMDVHQSISKNLFLNLKRTLKDASLVVLDGNMPESTSRLLIKRCRQYDTPVWFEPTDPVKAALPFCSDAWKDLSFISPNFAELSTMFSYISNEVLESQTNVEKAVKMSRILSKHIPFILVTLGSDGAILCLNNSFTFNGQLVSTKRSDSAHDEVTIKHFPAIQFLKKSYQSVSGAGDCLAGTVISGLLKGIDIDLAVRAGVVAASQSMRSLFPVPSNISDLVFSEAENAPIPAII